VFKWGLLAAVLCAAAAWIGLEAIHPSVVKDPSSLARKPAGDAFSIAALHRRLPPAALETVQRYVDLFATRQRRRVQDGLSRSGRYLETYRAIFRSEGVPEELVYLPMIESGYMETAVSPAQAVGVWQFIEETGKRYNLERTDWYDSRLDPIVSATAAARLLKHLYSLFNDWDLALAAYNAGPGTVRWAIKSNSKASLPTNYWNLGLPEETRAYVPAFIAMVLIAKNPSAFGFGPIPLHPRIVFDQVKVAPGVSLVDFSDHTGLDLTAVLELNPELLRAEIPPGDKPYTLRVPRGSKSGILDRIAGVKTLAASDYVVSVVEMEDTVESLASQFRVRVASIQKANQIQDGEDLALRRFIVIPL
jgi:membrane-bound lytic murein transglycosylase D